MHSKTLSAMLMALALTGCAGTHLAKPADHKNHAGRVTAARVIYVQPVGLTVRISKGAAGYGYTPAKPVIDANDQFQADARVKAVLHAYETKAPEILARALRGEGVAGGDETLIYVRPVSASVDANNGAVHVAVQVSVRHADAAMPWMITPVTQNMVDGAYWNVFRKPGIGDVVDVDLTKLVDSFGAAVVHEMKMAGWFR